ncbi:phosphoribosylglycinamide formyltransferase [Oscillatoria sp. FACHB-1407]|uniref:phosphoribosylglycinamide formyltransferase n=1 Tax=Oscillatoria sp. FACHB-1407 TaxID=2692847 RepID=UPI0016849ABE|nr:phosphoribosylglycinamide formyltransferase [Oscillatoria sp. FACHB-1407]MBD2461010.1 phosphoribosylglycinamide formyltransferase [Oscillatoria sp. FACHB-1407]
MISDVSSVSVEPQTIQNSSSSAVTASLVSPDIAAIAPHFSEPPLRLGVMASGSGSNFEAIAQAIADQELNAQIQVLVYNNPDAKAATRADRWGIPKVLLNHREFESREALDGAIAETMRQYQVDLIVMAGWMRIVTDVLINAFPDRLLNIHPSLLPSFRGARAVEQALAAGVKITGCTVHLVRLEVDSGPIIMQAAVPILPNDTFETLHQRIQVQEHRIFPAAIALLAHHFHKGKSI